LPVLKPVQRRVDCLGAVLGNQPSQIFTKALQPLLANVLFTRGCVASKQRIKLVAKVHSGGPRAGALLSFSNSWWEIISRISALARDYIQQARRTPPQLVLPSTDRTKPCAPARRESCGDRPSWSQCRCKVQAGFRIPIHEPGVESDRRIESTKPGLCLLDTRHPNAAYFI
jgi:hypothetical protein